MDALVRASLFQMPALLGGGRILAAEASIAQVILSAVKFQLLLRIDRRQVVLADLMLPIIHHAISLLLLVGVLLILDVHASIALI